MGPASAVDRANLLEGDPTERGHTFFTGVHRVVPACRHLEIRSPGGPVREAVRSLEQAGLVLSVQGRSFC